MTDVVNHQPVGQPLGVATQDVYAAAIKLADDAVGVQVPLVGDDQDLSGQGRQRSF